MHTDAAAATHLGRSDDLQSSGPAAHVEPPGAAAWSSASQALTMLVLALLQRAHHLQKISSVRWQMGRRRSQEPGVGSV
jgi:hypothetical protein